MNRNDILEEVAVALARTYPGNVSTNAFCSAVRSMKGFKRSAVQSEGDVVWHIDDAAQAAPDPQIALESERAEGWKRLAYNIADEVAHLWVCAGCGTRKSMEQIKGETAEAIACCPERRMAPNPSAVSDPGRPACGQGDEFGRNPTDEGYSIPSAPAQTALKLGDLVCMAKGTPFYHDWRTAEMKIVSLRIEPNGKQWASVIDKPYGRHRGYGYYDGETTEMDCDHLEKASSVPSAECK